MSKTCLEMMSTGSMMVMGCFKYLLPIFITLLLAGTPATSFGAMVDLELVLAVDVSGSVDEDEARLQRQGYLRAITHEQVIAAVQSGRLGRVAMTYVEWAGDHFQHTLVDWAIVHDMDSAQAFADNIANHPLQTEMWTSISQSINYAITRLAANPHKGARKVIDLSGDGANNSGSVVVAARDRAVARGITVNGLPIINGRLSPFGMPQIENLDRYYRECVIGGPGAFIIVANGFDDFARAIRRKLILEIAGVNVGPSRSPMRLHLASSIPKICWSGEMRRQDFTDDY